MKNKNKKPNQKKMKITVLLSLFSILILSLVLQARPLGNYDQKRATNSMKIPQSSISDAPESLWNQTWGGSVNDSAKKVALDSSDNIYITGTSNITEVDTWIRTGGEIVLLKYDSAGVLQWNRSWGSEGHDAGQSLAIDSSDYIYVIGTGANDIIVFLKYDSTGNLLWDKSWNATDAALDITIDLEDNILITGIRSMDMLLLKFNSMGDLIWERTWDGSFIDYGWAVEVDSLNNIYVTGLTRALDGSYDMPLLKYDSAGNYLWNTTWGSTGFEDGHSLAIDSSDDIYVGGCCSSFGAGGNDIAVVKFDSSGQLQWNKTIGGNETDGGWDLLTLDSADNLYVGASTDSFGAGGSDGILAKYNSSGEQLWNTTWGGAGDDGFTSLIVDSSDNIFLTGRTESFGAGGEDINLVKFGQIIDITTTDTTTTDTTTTETTTTETTTNSTTSPDTNFEISGYSLLLPVGGLGLIVVIIRKKRRFTAKS